MPLNPTPNTEDFPMPDADALAHSERLKQLIMHEIHQTDSMSFAQFMQLALYAPGLGYYSAGARKFGPEGDFVTAPEISPLFSQCLAQQCQQILEQLPNADILEFGAGSGAMAATILQELIKNNIPPAHYYILEVSAELRQRQKNYLREQLPDFYQHIIWLDEFPTKKFRGVILANEVLDAMPINRFRFMKTGYEEYVVASQNQEFIWQTKAANPKITEALESYQLTLPENYTSEINLFLSEWIKTIATTFIEGLVLILDYGFPRQEYYHPERSQGTLMCHYRHRAHDNPFLFPGLQDITAHVDFTAIAEAAITQEFHVAGYTNQASFLLNCGLLDLAMQTNLPEFEQMQMNQSIKKLTSAAEMGELFKVIALTRNVDFPLLGFKQFDQRMRL